MRNLLKRRATKRLQKQVNTWISACLLFLAACGSTFRPWKTRDSCFYPLHFHLFILSNYKTIIMLPCLIYFTLYSRLLAVYMSAPQEVSFTPKMAIYMKTKHYINLWLIFNKPISFVFHISLRFCIYPFMDNYTYANNYSNTNSLAYGTRKSIAART
mgnify:CR=1 FL=1